MQRGLLLLPQLPLYSAASAVAAVFSVTRAARRRSSQRQSTCCFAFARLCAHGQSGAAAAPQVLSFSSSSYDTTALPAVCSDRRFARYATMLKAQDRHVWANASAIPFQLCDDASLLHHSVFVCPVSREKNSLADPPVRLTCGHLLLHSSMMRLGKPPQGRFKCP